MPALATPLYRASDDPTMAIFRKFEDRSSWDLVIDNVPVFDVNVTVVSVPTPDGKFQKVKVVVDEARLAAMVETMSRRLYETGVPAGIFFGHRKPPWLLKKDEEQPDLGGWAWNYRVGVWGPAQKLGIICTLGFDRGCGNRAKQNPFRSIELYPREITPDGEDWITGIAALRNDPERDLGVLTFGQRHGFAIYSSSENQMDPTPVAPVDPTTTPGVDDVDPQFNANFMKCMGKSFPGFAKFYAAEVAAKYESAGPGTASPTDTFIPGAPPGQMEKQAAPAAPSPVPVSTPTAADDAARLRSTQQNIEAARYEREMAAMQEEVKALKVQNAEREWTACMASFENELTALTYQGYSFDLAKHVEIVRKKHMNRADFDEHKAMLVDLCDRNPRGRAPVNFERIQPVGNSPSPADLVVTEDLSNRAKERASRDKITYDAALNLERKGRAA